MFVPTAFISLAPWIVGAPQATAPLPSNRPGVAAETLPSGLHLLVSERPQAKLTAIEIRVRGAGPGNETPENNGVAHAIEHLLFKGTAERAPGAFDAAFERLGGEASAQTMRDGTAFRTTVFPDKWQDALNLFGELLQKPAFRADDWEQERTVILQEMAVARSDTKKAGLTALAAAAYPNGDPYRQLLMGTRENVLRFTPDDLRAFHTQWYRPQNLTVVVVGPVKTEEVRKAVSALFDAPPNPSPPASIDTVVSASADPLETITRAPMPTDAEQTARRLATLYLAFRAPRQKTDPTGAAACDVLAAILARGQSGVLGQSLLVSPQPNVLSVSAEYLPQERRALFVLAATSDKQDIGRTEDAILTALDAFTARVVSGDDKDGSLADGLETAKAAVIADARYRRETVEGEAQYLAALDQLNAPTDAAEQYVARVGAVTLADIARLLERYVTPAKRAVAIIGVAGKTGAQTASVGTAPDKETAQ